MPSTPESWLLFDYYRLQSWKIVLSSAFNAFREVRQFAANPLKTRKTLKMQHFIRMRLKTPTVDIAPVKLYPYVKKQDANSNAWACVLLLPVPAVPPMTHCVPMGWNSWNFWAFRADIFFGSAWWQAAPIKISAVFLVFSMVSAFWGKVFGACCFIFWYRAICIWLGSRTYSSQDPLHSCSCNAGGLGNPF